MAEMIVISLSAKVAAALSRTASVYHLASLVGIRSGIAAAGRDLELLRAFLRSTDSRRSTDELANAWVDRVRRVGFDLEDVVDEYSFLLAGRGGGFARACADVPAWFALATRLRKAREQLRALSAASAKEQYGIRLAEASSASPGGPRRNLSEAAHFIGDEEIVGFGAHKRLLMKWLTGDADRRRTIVTVCGMGGVGKTTLATSVYTKVAAGCHFDCAAWVAVSRNFTTDGLLRRILKELHRGSRGGENCDEMDYRSLVDALRRHLAHKRFFLLLDDVWDADAWFQLRAALPDSANGSRIVITTRSQEVAALGSNNRTIIVEPLPEHDAWSLFCSTTFREDADRGCPHHLRHWASKILDRCYGLPLAIVSVGNLMALKEKTEFAWKNVYDSLSWDGEYPGIGQVSSILNFSIDDLPYHLKRCFLYCSVYPEDMLIKRKIIIRVWIAHGLIEERGQRTMEEVADGYVNELVQRNLLIVALKNEYGRAKRCLIHDLIREVIVHRSRDDRFFQLSGSATRVDSKNKRARYLTLDSCKGDYHQSTRSMASLRSLHVFRSEFHASLFSGLRLLTVLNLWCIKTSELPGAVTNLRNLRYLGIRSTYIEELPKELGKLHNLQTLDAKWTMIKTLPSTITKLKNLRHVILFTRGGPDFSFPAPGAAIALPDGLQNLTCLQTLKYVRADLKMVRSLGSLELMRSLELFGVNERILADLPFALSKMSCLVRLGIASSDSNVTLDLESFSPPPLKLNTFAITGKLTRGMLPSWFSSLTSLVQLYLRSSELREDSVGILSSLPRLLHLSIVDAHTVRSLTFAAGCFPVLRELSLQGLPNLTRIELQTESLAYLRLLMLGRCPQLADVPKGIENLIHLKNLELFEMPSEFTEKIPDEGNYGGNHTDDQHITAVKNIFCRSGRLFEKKFYTNLSNVQEPSKTDVLVDGNLVDHCTSVRLKVTRWH